MRILRYITLLLVACTVSMAGLAEGGRMFRSLGIRQGLSSNTVNAMLVDRYGYLWVGTSMGLNRYDGYEMRSFRYFDEERTVVACNIRNLTEDGKGNIWIDYDNQMARYDAQRQRFDCSTEAYLAERGMKVGRNYRLTVDGIGNLWVAEGRMLWYHDYATGRTQHWRCAWNVDGREWHMAPCAEGLYVTNEREVLKFVWKTGRTQRIVLPAGMSGGSSRLRLYVDMENSLWVYSMVDEDIYHHKGTALQLPRMGGSNAIRDIHDDGHGTLWVATDHNGVFAFDRQGRCTEHVRHSGTDGSTITSDNVTCVTSDGQGSVWMGHFKTGISYCSPMFSLFRSRGLQYGDVSTMLYDRSGNLWLGTDGNGVFVERKDGSYVRAGLPGIIISSLLEDHNGTMWVGTYNGGLYKMQGTAVAKVYGRGSGLGTDAVWQMAEDNNNWIYISSGFAPLMRFSEATGKAEVVKMNNTEVQGMALAFDGRHTLYVGTYYGVWAYDTDSGKARCMLGNRRDTQKLLQPAVVNLCYDRKHDALWIAHMTGVTVMDMKRDSLSYIGQINGLFDSYVKNIVQDRHGDMWLATEHGISSIRTSKEGGYIVRNFTSSEGLQNTYFNTFAATVGPDGNILMGGNEGYTMIAPEAVKGRSRPVLRLTEVMVGDRQVEMTDDVVRLQYDDRQIVFRFFSGSLASANHVVYAYRIKGLSNEWVYTDDNKIRLFSLAHGSYTLEIKASDDNGEWGEVTRLDIKVAPPFYLSWWMMAIYALLAAAVAWMAWWYIRSRHRQRIEEQRISMEQGQQVKMSEMKLRFFTNISHDLRTPLTLIISPLQSLITDLRNKPWAKDSMPRLEMIEKNAQLLYNQVNMLLDFRRLDVGAETLRLQSIDVAQYIGNVCLSFHDYAVERGITLDYKPLADHHFVMVDAEKLKKIMYNLLSNAFKHTPDGGRIEVGLKAPLTVTVADNGEGISDDDKTKIFQRFYQAEGDGSKAGSGIGLHIVNEYVKMHGGTVTVTDNDPVGSVFTVELPGNAEGDVQKEWEPAEMVTDEVPQKDAEQQDGAEEKPATILVVDDNHDLRKFIADSLRTAYAAQHYQILTAVDGEEALRVLAAEDVTLVVTDIMMPKVDGLELCRRIKTDIAMSHIPVIMLTAKSTDVSVVEGLRIGADDYITKPFNIEHLRLRIDKFVEWSRTSHETFRRKMEVAPSEITITPLDEKFVQDAVDIVERNMSDTDFTVEALGKALCMSRANLYKKMMSIVGMGPHDFMRTIRLKRAHQLLEKSQKQISEIAYEVGYSSPKRFSENFKAHFGMTPTEFVKSVKKGPAPQPSTRES